MFVLVTGGSGSGKSEYAESRVLQFGDSRRYYIATMRCFDEESRKRVERHRRMRSGKGFETVECYLKLKNLSLAETPGKKTSILLECMSNLTANELFDPNGSGIEALEEIKTGIDRLQRKCDNLVVVTNELFSDGITYDDGTTHYLSMLGQLNQYMASVADEVVEIVYGLPVFWKRTQDSGTISLGESR